MININKTEINLFKELFNKILAYLNQKLNLT